MSAAATLTATTLEGQFFEVVQLMQNAENDPLVNTNGLNNLTSSISQDNKTMTVQATVPLEVVVGAGGGATYTGAAYMV